MVKKEIKPVSRKSDIVTQELEKTILIYDLITNRAFELNETSSLIWLACDGDKTVAEIACQTSKKLNSPVNEDFVWFALEQFKKENLIDNKAEISPPFENLSRREIIRRVGFASVVALPVITSLVAPTAARAQSGTCSGNCRCSNTSTSCNGNSGTFMSITYINCRTVSGNPNCNCVGPFGADNGAGSGFKAGRCSV